MKVNGAIVVKKYQLGQKLAKIGITDYYEITDLENNRVLAAKIIEKSSLQKN